MRIFGLVGWSGSGKTTLIEKLLPALVGRGFVVSTLKHSHHAVDVDRPGKDSHRHREAGATEAVLLSPTGWAVMHPLRGAPEPPLEALIPRLTPVDLLLVEGLKGRGHAKLEVHRPALGRPLLCRDDPAIVAVACDAALDAPPVPVLALDDTAAIADFIVEHCRLRS
ncbi:MAG: molybdopterin-guanine dinucleotide biosynthesis protein B [Rhodospirillales bacterium]